jgi:hypothetical protein
VNTSIRVVIPDEAAIRLAELARREFRAPGQQAAILVIEGLERAGLDPELSLEEGQDLLAKGGRAPRILNRAGSGDEAR